MVPLPGQGGQQGTLAQALAAFFEIQLALQVEVAAAVFAATAIGPGGGRRSPVGSLDSSSTPPVEQGRFGHMRVGQVRRAESSVAIAPPRSRELVPPARQKGTSEPSS